MVSYYSTIHIMAIPWKHKRWFPLIKESAQVVLKELSIEKMFSKLRLSSHKLSIEKGRHSHPKIPEENRLCKVCGVIENEKHFLLHCDICTRNKESNY